MTLWGAKYNPNKDSFMSIADTTFLRGFWCIIVVLVHVPDAYQNRIQDMLGSFAYIGVTFFFMTSAYGLEYSLEHKEGYMDYFWRRRLPPILIPALIANAIQVVAYGLNSEEVSVLSFININDWVKVLLLYYFVFWLIYGFLPKLMRGGGIWQDVVICLIVLGCSLVDYFTEFKITSRWIVEPLGFAYGIIAANYSSGIRNRIGKKWIEKSAVLMFLSGIIGIAYLKFKPVLFWGDYILKIFLGIAITSFVFVLISKFEVGNRVNEFLSKISYEVYLSHYAVFAILIAIDNYNMNSGQYVLVSICVTIIIAYMVFYINKLLSLLLRLDKFNIEDKKR